MGGVASVAGSQFLEVQQLRLVIAQLLVVAAFLIGASLRRIDDGQWRGRW
jgi:hypothetical protein